MNAIILKGAALRFHKVAPEPKQLPTPAIMYSNYCSYRICSTSSVSLLSDYEGALCLIAGTVFHAERKLKVWLRR
jgi:hypothetical protein